MTDPISWRMATRLVHAGTSRGPHQETSEALYLTSGYAYASAEQADARFAGTDEGYIYSRYGNPTVSMFEQRLAALEGAQGCFALASGMAAVSAAVLAPLKSGDRILAPRALFGSCLWILENLCPRYGIQVELIDGADLAQWRAACARPVQLALIETPANPMLDGVDIAAVREILPREALLIADNAFASPAAQNPLKFGADIVVYSATKHIDGQGRTLGGAILGSRARLDALYKDYLRHTGPALSPFNAWVLLKGLETIQLRVEAQARTAARLADVLAAHPKITRVLYPGRADHPHFAVHARQMRGGGTLLAFEVQNERAGAWALLNAFKLILISNNLGDAKSLATHPETTTHRRLTPQARAALGITPGIVRLSVGLEDFADLEGDLLQALEAV